MLSKFVFLTLTSFMAVTTFASTELENVSAVTLVPGLKLRSYVEGQNIPESLTAYNDQSRYPSCMLHYFPTAKKISTRDLVLIDTEPKYGGGRIEIYSLNSRMALNVIKASAEITEQTQACGLPSHPELCDENPPLVKSKSVQVDMIDSEQNRWWLYCTSEEVYSSTGEVPTIEMEQVMQSMSGLNLN